MDGKHTVQQDALNLIVLNLFALNLFSQNLYALNLFAQNLFAQNLFALNQVMAQMQRTSYSTGVWWKNS